MKIKVINKSSNQLPKYATEGSAGLDLMASFTQLDTVDSFKGINFEFMIENEIPQIVLYKHGRICIPTDLYMEIPKGYELQIRSRSGLSLKNGIIELNAPGTIDEDYRGNIGLIIHNVSDSPFIIKSGDRLSQGVLTKYEKIEFVEVLELTDTKRGDGGYGHTGK